MPQMELVQYTPQSNTDLMDAIRGTLDPVYQSRVPDATRAGLTATLNAMSQYTPAMNQFMDQLVNLIGAQLVKYSSWTNPLAVYKQGLLQSGETLEEVAIGLLKAHVYKPEADPTMAELFGQEKPDMQSVFHKVNRQEWYKVSINESQLERAFLNPNGLSDFISGMMASINTSDNVDEFVETASTLRRYYDASGFYKQQVPNISSSSATNNDAKQFLRSVRSLADTLPFLSRKYNARKMPMQSQPDDLMLLMTPEGKATMDVEALAPAFNIDKAQINQRITVIPQEYIDIPGFQGILTTKRFWILADKLMRMATIQNPVGLYNNYIWHHQEIISASPFENAILLTSQEQTSIVVRNYIVTGITAYTITDLSTNTAVTVTNGTATVQRGRAYLVNVSTTTDPANGPKDAVAISMYGNLSNLTHITQYGILVVGIDDAAKTVTVHAEATDDPTFETDLVLTIAGNLVQGTVGRSLDTDTTTISSTANPQISPTSGPVGTVLTATNGYWDTDNLTFAYAWFRAGTAISGATARTYTTVAADIGQPITVKVTATRTGYTAASNNPATSAAITGITAS